MTGRLTDQLVNSLAQALIVRRLRNTCCQYLTNHQKPIGLWQQIFWYFKSYRPSNRAGDYRLYLFYDQGGRPVGYGALQLHDSALYITECIETEQRGKGYGQEILSVLIEIGRREKRSLVAEIWASNERSVAMHLRAGFSIKSQRTHNGKDLIVCEL